ncbi:MAG TPA: lysophospholipid acyltransferase family protein [Methylophilaceae bacterium]|nr:lysophospholipid acyltransferase family protein [Methylophilaceae bacterium]
MLKAILRLYATLPLPVIHCSGWAVGWIMYLSDKKFARRLKKNLGLVRIASGAAERRHLVHRCALEIGKSVMETFAIWFKPQQAALKWVRECCGWEHVESALAQKRGIIFLTPHLGCYEITALYYAAHHPINVLYRPPRKKWLIPLVEAGRSRDQLKLAPTNMRGVRSLLKALKNGEAIGILPDQVPEPGEGEWAEFFGQPAYTMTLASKLAASTGAAVLMAFGERLPWGRGYIIHIEPLPQPSTPQHINDSIEKFVRRQPAQYLWSYRRFKKP